MRVAPERSWRHLNGGSRSASAQEAVQRPRQTPVRLRAGLLQRVARDQQVVETHDPGQCTGRRERGKRPLGREATLPPLKARGKGTVGAHAEAALRQRPYHHGEEGGAAPSPQPRDHRHPVEGRAEVSQNIVCPLPQLRLRAGREQRFRYVYP